MSAHEKVAYHRVEGPDPAPPRQALTGRVRWWLAGGLKLE